MEPKPKPTVDLKAKMLLSRRKASPIVTSKDKRQKTIDPDNALDSPSNRDNGVGREPVGKPPLVAGEKRNGSAKQPE